MDTVDLFKLISGLVIWLLGFLGGILPLAVRDLGSTIRSVLNMLAAGIFLSGSLCHLLPDASENRELSSLSCRLAGKTSEDEGGSSSSCSENYILACFFCGVGYLLILFLELFAHELQKFITRDDDHRHSHHEQTPLLINTPRSVDAETGDLECSGNSVAHAHVDGMLGEFRLLSGVVYIALSFHSIMEGVAIGAQPVAAWNIFVAIIAHKSLAAFALGLEFVTHGVGARRLLLCIILFSCMTPFGIFLGWLTLNGDNVESLTSGVFTALSSGTFLYVATMEIIPQELQDRKHQFLKNLALCVGFVGFGALGLWV